MKKEKIVLGMSGGVDSSVAALLLQNKGFEVYGVFMKNWDDKNAICSAEDDYADALSVCNQLNIPLKKIDYTKELFGESILPEIPEAISNNLKYNMWPLQEEAFRNFLFYENVKEGLNNENVPNVEFVKKDEPTHLMFNMATGSGKTMLMAACILHYMHLEAFLCQT